MELVKAPNGHLQIDGARICYKHFSGKADDFHNEGERDFALIIPNEEMADGLLADGWKVNIKPLRDEDDTPFMYMPVKVRFGANGMGAYLVSGKTVLRLNESNIHRLDRIQIDSVDMDIRPYDWEKGNRSGRTAYLHAIRVYQKIDRFTAEYEAEEWAANETTPF